MPWIYSTFAGHHGEVEDMLAKGDRVVLWMATSGTHTGTLEGLPPTGRPWMNKGIFLLRLHDNRIVEANWLFDQLNLLRQVGATVTLAS